MLDPEQVATIEALPADASLMEDSVPEGSEKTPTHAYGKHVMPSRLDDKPIVSAAGQPLSAEDLPRAGYS